MVSRKTITSIHQMPSIFSRSAAETRPYRRDMKAVAMVSKAVTALHTVLSCLYKRCSQGTSIKWEQDSSQRHSNHFDHCDLFGYSKQVREQRQTDIRKWEYNPFFNSYGQTPKTQGPFASIFSLRLLKECQPDWTCSICEQAICKIVEENQYKFSFNSLFTSFAFLQIW